MSTTPRTDALAASDAPHHEWVDLCRDLEEQNLILRQAAGDAISRITPLIRLGMCSPHESIAVQILQQAVAASSGCAQVVSAP